MFVYQQRSIPGALQVRLKHAPGKSILRYASGSHAALIRPTFDRVEPARQGVVARGWLRVDYGVNYRRATGRTRGVLEDADQSRAVTAKGESRRLVVVGGLIGPTDAIAVARGTVEIGPNGDVS